MSARIWMRLGMAVLLSGSVALAQQQTPPPAKQDKPKKAKKVWGEEDLKDIRKPWDEQPAQKQTEEAKKDQPAKEGEAPAAKPASDDPSVHFPKTVAETVKAVDDKNEEIKFAEETVQDLQKQVEEATSDEQKAAVQKKLDAQIAAVKEAEAELKQLDAHLKNLRAKAAPAPPPAQKPPESQPN